MMRNASIGVFTLSLLLGASAPALVSAAKPADARTISPRKEARARFVEYLNSPAYQAKLDVKSRQQLFVDLRAQIGNDATLAKYSADAALLVEMKRLHNGTPEVVLTERYGLKLKLARVYSGIYSDKRDSNETILGLQLINSKGVTEALGTGGLAVFGITKPKHFKALLEQSMTKLAPEDYIK